MISAIVFTRKQSKALLTLFYNTRQYRMFMNNSLRDQNCSIASLRNPLQYIDHFRV